MLKRARASSGGLNRFLVVGLCLSAWATTWAAPQTLLFDLQVDWTMGNPQGISAGLPLSLGIQFDQNASVTQISQAGPGNRYFFSTDSFIAQLRSSQGSTTYVSTDSANSLALVRDNAYVTSAPFIPQEWKVPLDGITVSLSHPFVSNSGGVDYDMTFGFLIRNRDTQVLSVSNNKFPTYVNFDPSIGSGDGSPLYVNSFSACVSVHTDPNRECVNGSFGGHITASNPSGLQIPPGLGLNVSKSLNLAGWYSDMLDQAQNLAGVMPALMPLCAASASFACIASGAALTGLAAWDVDQLYNILHDPPDQNYSQVFERRVLTPALLDSSSGLPENVVSAWNANLIAQAKLSANFEAWRRTLERYQAAKLAGDANAIATQDAALSRYVLSGSALAQEASADAAALAVLLNDYYGSLSISGGDALNNLLALQENGFDPTGLAGLKAMGFTADDVSDALTAIRGYKLGEAPVSLFDTLAGTGATMDGLRQLTDCPDCYQAPEPGQAGLIGLGLVATLLVNLRSRRGSKGSVSLRGRQSFS